MIKGLKNIYNFSKVILTNKNKKELLCLFFISMFSNLLIIAIPLFQKKIIDTIIIGKIHVNSIVLFLLLSIIFSILMLVEVFLILNVQKSAEKNISFIMLNSITRKENFIIKTRGSGAFMSNLFGDSSQIGSIYGENFFSKVFSIISTITIIIIGSRWTLSFPIIIISSYLIMSVFTSIFNRQYIKFFKKGRELVFKLNPKLLEFIESKKTIMIYDSVNENLKKLETIFDERNMFFKKSMLASTLGDMSINIIQNISMVIFFIISMIEILNGKLELSSFITMTSYFAIAYIPIYSIKNLKNSINTYEMLYERNKDTFDVPLKTKLPENKDVYIENISFKYDEDDILKNINLEIDKLYGVVGISGEGKTTLLKLMTGEVDSNEGAIYYGGNKITEYPLPIIYSGYRIYLQETEILDDNLSYNICLNKIGLDDSAYKSIKKDNISLAKASFEWLDLAINNMDTMKINDNENKYFIKDIFNLTEKEVNDKRVLEEISISLADGDINYISKHVGRLYTNSKYYIMDRYDNIIKDLGIEYLDNRNFGQRGNKLSGGEKNKIALARFLLSSENLPVIIDEPFTNLDLISESNNLNILKKYLKDTKGILVSHKMNIIQALSDEIIIIEDGKITDSGSHNHLLQTNPFYKELNQ